MAPLYARLLGIPAVFVNKAGAYASPAPVRWLPGSTGLKFPGHGTIADSDGTVKAQMSDSEGVINASVALDPARKTRTAPRVYGRYVYPAGAAGELVLLPAWLFARVYALSRERRRRARLVAATKRSAAALI